VVDELQRSWHCETRNIRAWRFHGEFCPETTRKHPLSVRGSCLCLDDNPPKLCCTRSSCISVIQKRSHAFDSESCSKEAAGIRAPAPNGTLPVAFQLVAVFQRVQNIRQVVCNTASPDHSRHLSSSLVSIGGVAALPGPFSASSG